MTDTAALTWRNIPHSGSEHAHTPYGEYSIIYTPTGWIVRLDKTPLTSSDNRPASRDEARDVADNYHRARTAWADNNPTRQPLRDQGTAREQFLSGVELADAAVRQALDDGAGSRAWTECRTRLVAALTAALNAVDPLDPADAAAPTERRTYPTPEAPR